MSATATTPTLKLTKGSWGDRYNVRLDGTYIGWIIRPTEFHPGWTPYLTDAGVGVRGDECATRAEAVDHLCDLMWRMCWDHETRTLCRAYYLAIR